MTLVRWICKNYHTFGLFNMYCSSLFLFFIFIFSQSSICAIFLQNCCTVHTTFFTIHLQFHFSHFVFFFFSFLFLSFSLWLTTFGLFNMYCSSFFFFFSQSSICALFSTKFLHYSYSVFHCSSTVPFWLATLSSSFFLFFFLSFEQ